MRYSVWNYPLRQYDYYEDGRQPKATHASAPPSKLVRERIGLVPEAATWKLPMDAKKVGTGDLPQGRIASPQGSMAGLGDITVSVSTLGIAAILGYLAWRQLR